MSQKEVEINENDVLEALDQLIKVPAIILKTVVSTNSNVVKNFQSQIEDYKSQLSSEEIAKIRKVIKMPVPELQEILNNAYIDTRKEQLKILADPKAAPFISKNLEELKKVLF
ncbi:MAG: hypothetical protein QMD61_08860 [Methanobacterium sp.]|nr:hypothetical protein [Methanobacterium sp.]